jgi:hypothetical protein
MIFCALKCWYWILTSASKAAGIKSAIKDISRTFHHPVFRSRLLIFPARLQREFSFCAKEGSLKQKSKWFVVTSTVAA